MQQLTPQGQQQIADIAQRYGLSFDAVMTMLQAVIAGGGTMAQFQHPELGGSGQWMQGGMTMVGDMFNNNLKATVDNLCNELSRLLANSSDLFVPPARQGQMQGQGGQMQSQGGQMQGQGGGFSVYVPAGNWWPDELGAPNATGSQNNVRYAIFANTRRLALDINGQLKIYDTLDHQISGVSQQQSGDASVTFTSQYGVVSVNSLPLITGPENAATAAASPAPEPASPESSVPIDVPPHADADTILATLERLATLKQKGIISEQEFAAKKAELLNKL